MRARRVVDKFNALGVVFIFDESDDIVSYESLVRPALFSTATRNVVSIKHAARSSWQSESNISNSIPTTRSSMMRG